MVDWKVHLATLRDWKERGLVRYIGITHRRWFARGLLDKPLQTWVADIGCGSWPQLLLKFLLSQPAVTCVIPGTRRREHMQDNAMDGLGSVPAPGFWANKLSAMVD